MEIPDHDFVRRSGWYGVSECRGCKASLTDNEEMYSGGVCPYCGHEGSATVCDTQRRVYRKVRYFKRRGWWFPKQVHVAFEKGRKE